MKNDINETNPDSFFGEKLIVVNVGIEPFFESLKSLDVPVVQVNWSLPAEGDTQIIELLDHFI